MLFLHSSMTVHGHDEDDQRDGQQQHCEEGVAPQQEVAQLLEHSQPIAAFTNFPVHRIDVFSRKIIIKVNNHGR